MKDYIKKDPELTGFWRLYSSSFQTGSRLFTSYNSARALLLEMRTRVLLNQVRTDPYHWLLYPINVTGSAW